MANLNINEYGQVIRANIGIDVSTNIGLKFKMQPKIGSVVEKTEIDGVAVGSVNVVVGDQTFLANKYLEYTTQDGDIDQSGMWRIKGEAQINTTVKAVGDYRRIAVLS